LIKNKTKIENFIRNEKIALFSDYPIIGATLNTDFLPFLQISEKT